MNLKITSPYQGVFPILTLLLANPSFVSAEEKHQDDPTKIVTKLGLGYNDDLTISGSIGLDPVRMLNMRTTADGDDWRIGGSWLLPIGIINVNFSRTEYDNDAYKNNYSIGTFIPLSYFGVEPLGWQIFPMAGYAYNDGEFAVKQHNEMYSGDYVLMANSSHSGYLGAFALKPLTDTWSILAFGGGALGSDDYSSYWGGGGLSYKINEHQSFNFYGVLSEDDFGKNEKIGFSYTYEFK